MRILIVDDHVLIRDALRNVLTELAADATILEAATCAQCLEAFEQSPDIDLILLDLALPDRDGFLLLDELRRRFATAAIVVLSASNDQEKIKRAFDLGAVGFIPKGTGREVMFSALQLIFAGGIYIPREILDQKSPPVAPSDKLDGIPPKKFLMGLGLTDRQVDVLQLLLEGKSNKVIARLLKMAEPTVKNHLTVILKALKVANRTEAVIKIGRLQRELIQKGQSFD
jgi:DNA-binding NarL/FixJ family response regulator